MRKLLALLAFLLLPASALASNCSGYPYVLTNGQIADANQVMSNFNSILSCANNNLAKNGTNADISGFSNPIVFKTSTVSSGSFVIPFGTAPVSPLPGSVWSSTSGLYFQSNSGTAQIITGTSALSGDLTGNMPSPIIAAGAVNNAKMAAMAAYTVKGNATNASATPTDIDRCALGYMLGLTGQVAAYATQTTPACTLLANGAAVSRTTYANLFAVIGTTFGSGDGSTTFNLPNLRGYFIRGFDNGAGVDPGRVFGSTQTDALASHVHGLGAGAGVRVVGTGSGFSGTSGLGGTIYQTDATGGTETRPKNVALNYYIRY